MTIAASVNPQELNAIVTDRYVGAYFEARLLYAPGTSFLPGTSDPATFLSNELTQGANGYQQSGPVGDVQRAKQCRNAARTFEGQCAGHLRANIHEANE